MRITLVLLTLCITGMTHPAWVSAWDFPVSIDITQVSFNYTGSNAIPLKKNAGTTSITAPEWVKTWGGSVVKNDPFAFTKGFTPTVKALFTSPDPDPMESVTIEAVTQSTGDENGFQNYPGWNLNDDTINFTYGVLSVEGTFPTSTGSSLKNSVGKCRTKFLWKISEVGGGAYSQELGYSTHNYYILLATPSSFVDYYTTPETVGVPWTEVLDLACQWANNVEYDTDCVAYSPMV